MSSRSEQREYREAATTLRLRSRTMTTQDGISTASEPQAHAARLLQAMARVCGNKGVALATIADIVREAGVSKRTFYEYFDSKEACFFALYRAASGSALRALRNAIDTAHPWQSQVEHALHAYLDHLAAAPDLSRTLFVEIHHLGPAGIRQRREVMQQFADFVLETVNAPSAQGGRAPQPPLTPNMAMAAVGAIHELMLQAIERSEADQLARLTPAASEIVRLLTGAGSRQTP
jgi:AcrR family transcriptional regulator